MLNVCFLSLSLIDSLGRTPTDAVSNTRHFSYWACAHNQCTGLPTHNYVHPVLRLGFQVNKNYTREQSLTDGVLQSATGIILNLRNKLTAYYKVKVKLSLWEWRYSSTHSWLQH